ncbi:MAG TPA: ABC transporter permease, partial [Thermoanaerobaculia bacterium]|nr:ABC transporter permease [Thermoanaerobaculia bacterium]
MSLPTEIALRYFRRRSSRLVSRVSVLAISGVALGVMALVIAMALLTGYRDEIQSKLIGANADIVVFPLTSSGISDPGALEARLRAFPRVRAAAPVLYWQGTAASEGDPDGTNAIVKGIDPERERAVAPVGRVLEGGAGLFARDAGGREGCAIGADLAGRLRLRPGDTVVLTVPDMARTRARFALRRAAFRVARIFRTNFYEYDSEWVFVSRPAAQALARFAAPANVLEIKLDSIERTPEATARVRELLGEGFSVTDWRSLNRGLFSALTVQKITLFLVIGLIVAVSTFTIVATLVMSVQEKKRDIGVLSAIGAPGRLVSGVFLRLGILLGGTGVAVGLAAGAVVCAVLTRFRLVRFPPDVAEIYFVSFVPFVVRLRDVAAIALFSAAVIAAAAWFPARRAARVEVAEAL